MNMRRIMNITEGVDFRPADWEVLPDGTKSIGYPKDTTRHVKVTCKWCNGTGRDIQADAYEREFGRPSPPCDFCDGSGQHMEWQYDFPQMRVTYGNQGILSSITGKGDSNHGWIPPEDIPEVRRKLIRLMNTDAPEHLARPSTETHGPTSVDRTQEIPRIRRGSTMIDGGLSPEQIRSYGKQMLEILDWAQKHGVGACWA